MTKKRKHSEIEKFSSSRKRIKLNYQNEKNRVPSHYHPASKVHNFMLNDPIIDWINYTNRSIVPSGPSGPSGPSSPSGPSGPSGPSVSDNFFGFITKTGQCFETGVMKIIGEKLSELENPDGTVPKILTIAHNYQDIRLVESYKKTIQAMKDQVAVIYQGVLHGDENFNTFGSPDLLIRSDILNFLVDTLIIDEEQLQIEAPGLGPNKFHYRVVDIKFCTLKLRVDGKHLCNDGRTPANKGQLIVYNRLLEKAQGYLPETCYILGRAWKVMRKGEQFECLRCDERLGSVNIATVDSFYNTKVDKALEWLDRLRINGKNWTTYPSPSVPELYPNMCHQSSNSFEHRLKKKIAHEIDDITLLWNCGVKHRERAHALGIYKLTDRRLTTEIMGLPDTPRTKIIDQMLKFNQGLIGDNMLVIPEYIPNNPYDWQRPITVEFFLDFETLSSIFDNFEELPNRGGPNGHQSIVFMIGLGVSIRQDHKLKWSYYNFRVPELTDDFEFQIFDQMYKTIEEITSKYDQEISETNVYHWGNIEENILTNMNNKYNYKHDWDSSFNLVNFNKIFQDDGIMVKGVYGFGLKAIGNALINYNLIKLNGWDNSVSDGLDAMVQAFHVYNNPTLNHQQTIQNLIKYNEVDVRMVEKIVNYLRKYHTPGIIIPKL